MSEYYTKEQKKKALNLYAECWNSYKVVEILGYPKSAGTVRSWVRKYKGPWQKKIKQRDPKYPYYPSASTKLKIVERCLKGKESIESLSKETNYHHATIYQWIHQYQVGGVNALSNQQNLSNQKKAHQTNKRHPQKANSKAKEKKKESLSEEDTQKRIAELEARIEQLEMDNAIGQAINDLLKKK